MARVIRRPAGALSTLALAAAAACGGNEGGTGPGTTPTFDAARVTSASTAAQAVFRTPVLAAIMTGVPRLGSGVRPVRPGGWTPPPSPALGATYVRDAQGRFVRDPARTGAPANGTRYVVRGLDPMTGAPTGAELGWADVVTEANGERRVTVSDGQTVVYASRFVTGGLRSDEVLTEWSGTAGTGDGAITFRSTTTFDSAGAARGVGLLSTLATPGGAATVAALGFGRLTAITTASTVDASFESRYMAPLRAGDVGRTAITVGGRALVLEQAAAPFRGSPLLPLPPGAEPFYVPGDTTRATLDGAPFGLVVVPSLGGTLGPAKFLRTDGSSMPVEERRALTTLLVAGASLPSVAVIGMVVELWQWQLGPEG